MPTLSRLEAVPLLVLGLGNPEPEYAGTRHNLGARCVAELARRLGTSLGRRRWRSLVGMAQVREGDEASPTEVWLAFPQTYMNESGRAAAAAVRDLRVPLNRVWVVYDDLDLPLCRLRIRERGSAGGHNGLKSLIAHLHSSDFVRFRVGVGRPVHPGQDPIDHLLTRFSRPEAQLVDVIVERVADAVEDALKRGLERAMETYNRAGSLGCQEVMA